MDASGRLFAEHETGIDGAFSLQATPVVIGDAEVFLEVEQRKIKVPFVSRRNPYAMISVPCDREELTAGRPLLGGGIHIRFWGE